jgi:hypothetical protein
MRAFLGITIISTRTGCQILQDVSNQEEPEPEIWIFSKTLDQTPKTLEW